MTGLNTGAFLFIPDLAVKEVCSRVQNRLFEISENRRPDFRNFRKLRSSDVLVLAGIFVRRSSSWPLYLNLAVLVLGRSIKILKTVVLRRPPSRSPGSPRPADP